MSVQDHTTWMIETRWGWYTAASTIAGYKFPEEFRGSHVGSQYWNSEKEALKVAASLTGRGYSVGVIPHFDGVMVV